LCGFFWLLQFFTTGAWRATSGIRSVTSDRCR
jgi:hypothetical protein